jgi:hypothetical protein
MPEPDASHSTNERVKSSNCSTGAVDKACLSSWNAFSVASVLANPSMERRRVSGAAMAS